MLHSVIMAGGAGTRFWPASRVDCPKQLLKLAGDRSMIQSTVDRVLQFSEADKILIVTNQRLVTQIREQLSELPASSIVGEPCKRDTAPCIALAGLWTMRSDPDATMVVMPADHLISTDQQFKQAIEAAVEMVDEDPERIITFGIKPTYPAEVFGYIERDDERNGTHETKKYRVKRFREKPDRTTAKQFLDSGSFYWNSGIFIWKSKTIIDALRKHQPEMMDHMDRVAAHFDLQDFDSVFEKEFSAINGISIDYAVMEKYPNTWVIEAPFTWDDVGNWTALSNLLGSDEVGNTVAAKHVSIDSTNCIIRAEDGHLVATLGVEDLIVVQTGDATLVARRNRESEVKKIVEQLQSKNWSEYL